MGRRRKIGTAYDVFTTKRCGLFPECTCYYTVARWAGNLLDDDEGEEFTLEELKVANDMIFYSLACLSRHCPHPKMKRWAKAQLRDRWWDELKRIGPGMGQ
jgi:hypothetical protein